MDFVKDAFARMNTGQLRSFLLYSADCLTDTDRGYKERLEKDTTGIYKRLESLYPNRAEQDEALVDLSKALTAYEYVYMELGMKPRPLSLMPSGTPCMANTSG